MLGVLVDERKVTKLAGSDQTGTDEKNLALAARRYGCELREIRLRQPRDARRELTSYLRDGKPCLICVHQWKHWVAVVREERGKFILLDSEDAAVLTIVDWRELRHMWGFRSKEPGEPKRAEILYDLYPLVPRFRVQIRASFSIARARFLRRPENRGLAQHWDEYLEDLLHICKPKTPLSENVISLRLFLRRHGGMIVAQISYWHGRVDVKAIRKVLLGMRFVADTHGLIIHRDDEKRAIAGITALLTLWAGARYGVAPVYDPPTPRRGR
jgi:hypothetical protein